MKKLFPILLVTFICAAACKGDEATQAKPEPKAAADQSDAAPADPGAKLAAKLVGECKEENYESCRALGVLHAEGRGVRQDLDKARRFYDTACKGGAFRACNNLALVYAEGIGVDKDQKRANELFRKACDKGESLACRNYGLVLRDGRGTKKDLVQARVRFLKACEAGNAPAACSNIGVLELEANKPKEALPWFEMACKIKEPTGCRYLGALYAEGRGVKKDYKIAREHFETSCVTQNPVGCRNLGVLLAEGLGGPKDEGKAQFLLKNACLARDRAACDFMTKRGWATTQKGAPKPAKTPPAKTPPAKTPPANP